MSSSSSLTSTLMASLGHPSEVVALVRFKLSLATLPYASIKSPADMTRPGSDFPEPGAPDYNYAYCYFFLNKTSRSFARVIQELPSDIKHAVCIFYLVLRALDTIEDDMTLDLPTKTRLMTCFHETLYEDGWQFHGSGPNEKDRSLLERFDVVIAEFKALRPGFQAIIAHAAHRMALGMLAFRIAPTVATMSDYNLYTHYVAGLVGLGLTGLFSESGAEPSLQTDITTYTPEINRLANSMGLFLQKVNIIKDVLEDWEEGRWFWPKAVWAKYLTMRPAAAVSASDPQALLNAPRPSTDSLPSLSTSLPTSLPSSSSLSDSKMDLSGLPAAAPSNKHALAPSPVNYEWPPPVKPSALSDKDAALFDAYPANMSVSSATTSAPGQQTSLPDSAMGDLFLPANRSRALACLNHLCVDAITLVPESLEYMSRLSDPKVFTFCLIPQVMALATFTHFFNSDRVLVGKGGKIRRGLTVKLMLECKDMASLKAVYMRYVDELKDKNAARIGTNPFDDSYLPMASALGKIEQWIRHHDKLHPATTHSRSASSHWAVSLVVAAMGVVLLLSVLPLTE